MINLDSMEWDHFHIIKQKVLRDLINELQGLEIPPDWRPKEALGLVIRILEDKERSC
jgi:hypothetical protein